MIQSVIYKKERSAIGMHTQDIIARNFPWIKIVETVKDLNEDLFRLLKSGIDLFFIEVDDDAKIDQMIFDKIANTGSKIVLICTKNRLPIETFNQDIFFYLEKPLCTESMKRMMDKFELKKQDSNMFLDSDRISVPVKDGWEIINIEEIVYCQADSNYTDLHLINGKRRKVSKPLKTYASCLCPKSFVRVHQSYLVNAKYMKKLSKDKSASLLLTNGVEIPVSRTGKKELLKLFL